MRAVEHFTSDGFSPGVQHDAFSWRSTIPWVAAALPVGMVAAMAGPGQAPAAFAAPQDGWADGGPDSGRMPDNSEHTHCWAGSFTWAQARDASMDAAANLDRQTAMFDTKVGCSGATDAVWHRTTRSGIDGFYVCNAFNSAGECETATVALQFNNMDSDNDWKQTACHELGHSVGLTHKAGSCLSTNSNDLVYGEHHVAHVNCKCDNP